MEALVKYANNLVKSIKLEIPNKDSNYKGKLVVLLNKYCNGKV